jgi:hypothetical protein
MGPGLTFEDKRDFEAAQGKFAACGLESFFPSICVPKNRVHLTAGLNSVFFMA